MVSGTLRLTVDLTAVLDTLQHMLNLLHLWDGGHGMGCCWTRGSWRYGQDADIWKG
jgi:hypothetical protein